MLVRRSRLAIMQAYRTAAEERHAFSYGDDAADPQLTRIGLNNELL